MATGRQALGEKNGIHRPSAGAADAFKLTTPIFKQGVEHAPGKCTMGPAALQREVDPDGGRVLGWHLAVDLYKGEKSGGALNAAKRLMGNR